MINVALVVAPSVNGAGDREVLGVDVGPGEDSAFWTEFLRGLVARGLRGVRLVISDAHEGLRQAIATVLQGASWQRCRVHFMRNILSDVPKAVQAMAAAMILGFDASTLSLWLRPITHTPTAASIRPVWNSCLLFEIVAKPGWWHSNPVPGKTASGGVRLEEHHKAPPKAKRQAVPGARAFGNAHQAESAYSVLFASITRNSRNSTASMAATVLPPYV